MLAILAALQIASAPEFTWAEIALDDTRGSTERIEILPQLRIDDGRRDLEAVLVRRTVAFGGATQKVEWADSRTCPALLRSLDRMAEVKPWAPLSAAYDGAWPPPAPPPHRTIATVTRDGATISVEPGSSIGEWLQGVLDTTRTCWRPERPGGA